VIPITDGYAVGSCIKNIPIAGRDITQFYINSLRDRNEQIPAEEIVKVAVEIKERYGYISKSTLLEEYVRFDRKTDLGVLGKRFRQYEYKSRVANRRVKVDIGYEQFLGPEILFNPEIVSPNITEGIDCVIDQAI